MLIKVLSIVTVSYFFSIKICFMFAVWVGTVTCPRICTPSQYYCIFIFKSVMWFRHMAPPCNRHIYVLCRNFNIFLENRQGRICYLNEFLYLFLNYSVVLGKLVDYSNFENAVEPISEFYTLAQTEISYDLGQLILKFYMGLNCYF